MKYAKVFVTNITKDTVPNVEDGIRLHHVVCDCTIEGGRTEKQAYRIFSNQEYKSVISNGYYEIPDCNSILEDINLQIKETIDQYPSLSINDIKVYLEEEHICFQMGEFLHKEKVIGFLTAYVNGKEVSDIDAISLNTARLLEKLEIRRVGMKGDEHGNHSN